MHENISCTLGLLCRVGVCNDLSMLDEAPDTRPDLSRRRFLVGAAAVGVTAWAAPSVLHLDIAGAAPSGARRELVINGGFETGNFAGWTVADQSGGSGTWVVSNGHNAPSGAFVPVGEGTYSANSEQSGPGSHILYQDVALPAGSSPTFSFLLYYNNQAGAFFSPPTLDKDVSPNQQYRVDVMKPAAAVDSVAAGDVLATVFQTNPGDPLVRPYGPPITFDLTPFAGQLVRLRFAEVDNQLFFEAGVDSVSVLA